MKAVYTVKKYHSALRWILNLEDEKGRLERWKLRLKEFKSEVVHRAGIIYKADDALSRLERESLDKTEIKEDIPTLSNEDTPPIIVIVFFE